MRVVYTYECEVCEEQERVTFNSADDAPERMTCTICGCTDKMVRLAPKPSVHNRYRRRR